MTVRDLPHRRLIAQDIKWVSFLNPSPLSQSFASMTTSFNGLPWHDAVLLSVEIDRRNPGNYDEARICILWGDQRRSRVRFLDCYALEARMNFGVVAAETLRAAVEISDSDDVRAIRATWTKLGAELSDLRCYMFETNSTASTIKIYARRWIREDEN